MSGRRKNQHVSYHITGFRPTYLDYESEICAPYKFKYYRGNGLTTLYAHYENGMEVWEHRFNGRPGWELAMRLMAVEEDSFT